MRGFLKEELHQPTMCIGLNVENLSRKNIFIASGEIIAGGRQDRMVSRDTIMLASQQKIQLPVMCVEEGRWSEKEKKFSYQEMANLHLRRTLDKSKNQVMIWREIMINWTEIK
jgi:hypothetical protein